MERIRLTTTDYSIGSKTIAGVIKQQRRVQLVYLFGSLTEGTTGNDVDLAILTENSPPFSLRNELIAFLGTERLDIVDLNRASPALCFEIIRSGQIIICG
jgi:predicted nucleotidyltransferase